MFGIEEADNGKDKHGLPPGFRFHPTDEELIVYYLASKTFQASNFHGVSIAEVDLNRCEPWELPGTNELCHFFISKSVLFGFIMIVCVFR